MKTEERIEKQLKWLEKRKDIEFKKFNESKYETEKNFHANCMNSAYYQIQILNWVLEKE